MGDTPLMGLNTIRRISKDPIKAKEEALKLTGDLKVPAYWVGDESFWRSLPKDVRKDNEVGRLIMDAELTAKNVAVVKYDDKTTVRIKLEDLHRGHVVYPPEITRKLFLVKPGETNLLGQQYRE